MKRKNIRRRWLYRYYSREGRLLYIGETVSPRRRDGEHRRDSGWYDMVSSRTVQKLGFCSRSKALRVEKAAIEKEYPLFNQTHNDRFMPDWVERRSPMDTYVVPVVLVLIVVLVYLFF